jgi:predicted RNA-binding protein with PUA domain
MAVYCISYDLKSNNYEALINAIQSYGLWWHQSKSTWFIETTQTSRQVTENLRNFIQAGDKIMVIQVRQNWFAVGHTEEEYNWMRNRNF